jgi:hypothetical protein
VNEFTGMLASALVMIALERFFFFLSLHGTASFLIHSCSFF